MSLAGLDRRAWAWALYDWANSAFPTVVSTFVVAAYFTQGIAPDPATGQAQWGWMQALAGLGIALLSPVLGAVADSGGRRRAKQRSTSRYSIRPWIPGSR